MFYFSLQSKYEIVNLILLSYFYKVLKNLLNNITYNKKVILIQPFPINVFKNIDIIKYFRKRF